MGRVHGPEGGDGRRALSPLGPQRPRGCAEGVGAEGQPGPAAGLGGQPCPQAGASAYLDGVMGVRSFPMVWITLLPQTQRPVQMPTPP